MDIQLQADVDAGQAGQAATDPIGKIYRAMRSVDTGGTAGPREGSINGTPSEGSARKIVEILRSLAGLGNDPLKQLFFDAGSGHGHVAALVSAVLGVRAMGMEVVSERHKLALNLMQHPRLIELNPCCTFVHGDLLELTTMEGVTHLHMFNVGIPSDVMRAIARAFNQSKTAQFVILFRSHKDDEISDYGFHLEAEPLATFSISMFRSGETHTAYLYRRQEPVIAQFMRASLDSLANKRPKRSNKSNGR